MAPASDPQASLAGDFRTVVWRPAASLGAKLFLPLLVAGVTLVATQGADVTPAVLGVGTLVVVAGAIAGLCQAVYWRWRLGGVAYELRGDQLVVTDRGAVVSAWNRHDVDHLRVRSSIGWWDLITNSHDFPRLVVRSGGRVAECPPVLVWGREAPIAFQDAARSWLKRPQ